MRVGSLFSGAGGLDLAVHALWPDAETAWFAESDPHAAAVFAHHWPDTPNLGDLSAVDWDSVEPVDVLVGGYPCQPYSHAGKRKGFDDDRDGWPWFRDAIGVLRPRLVLLENVAGHVAFGAHRTVGDLAALGFDADWATVRASDVGAPHRRERWFCVAYPDLEGLEGWDTGGVRERAGQRFVGSGGASADVTLLKTPTGNLGINGGSQHPDKRKAGGHGPTLADEVEHLLPTPTVQHTARNATAGRSPDAKPYSPGWTLDDVRYADRWRDYAAAIARWEAVYGRPAPDATDRKGRLSPAFVEWMMGWDEGWTAVAGASRAQRLKQCGNGVVPLQAVHAYSGLLDRAREVAA